MNLPAYGLMLPLERPGPSLQAPGPQPSEASGGAERRGDRGQAFDQALEQQLGRAGGPAAGRAGGARPRRAPGEALPAGALGGVSASWSLPTALEDSLPLSPLGVLLRPREAATHEEEPLLTSLDPGWQGAPVWLPLPPGAPPPAEEGLTAVPVAELPRAVLGHVRWTVERQQPLTQLEFHLAPPALGPVHLQVSYTEGVVGVQLTALSLLARQSLEAQAGQIHAILQAANLTPGQVRIVAPAAGRGGASGGSLRQEPGGLGAGLPGRRRQPGASNEAIRQA
ncbi:MAG: flagellar hook-length control protein FliK [Candidatus Sericytochromatia bacterium]|nr:flagellar hook-length control protein FliK [Candidatus Sericytochromatia bacterium]